MSATTKTTKLTTTLLSSGDVLRLLGVSREGVYFLMRSGRLRPVARTASGVALFDPHEIEKLRREREQRGLPRRSPVPV